MSVFAPGHGDTAWNVTGQHTGTTDLHLLDNGRRVARRLRDVGTGATRP